MRDRCPVCGRRPAAQAATRHVKDVTLAGLYRHQRHGRTYLHELTCDFAGMAGEVTLDV